MDLKERRKIRFLYILVLFLQALIFLIGVSMLYTFFQYYLETQKALAYGLEIDADPILELQIDEFTPLPQIGASKRTHAHVGVGSSVSHVTAYTGVESCHYAGCIMASGKPAYKGAVACPRALPLGTSVVISGVTYTCEDRTAKRFDGRYDIFFGYTSEDHARALRFGIQDLEVTILR